MLARRRRRFGVRYVVAFRAVPSLACAGRDGLMPAFSPGASRSGFEDLFSRRGPGRGSACGRAGQTGCHAVPRRSTRRCQNHDVLQAALRVSDCSNTFVVSFEPRDRRPNSVTAFANGALRGAAAQGSRPPSVGFVRVPMAVARGAHDLQRVKNENVPSPLRAICVVCWVVRPLCVCCTSTVKTSCTIAVCPSLV